MKFTFSTRDNSQALDATRTNDGVTIQLNDTPEQIQIIAYERPRLTFSYKNQIITAHIARQDKNLWIHLNGGTHIIERGERVVHPTLSTFDNITESGVVTAPMPGQIRAVLVENGVDVQEGQPLLLLEAMKMEIRVNAPSAGQVTLQVTQGQSVEREQILATVEPSKQ